MNFDFFKPVDEFVISQVKSLHSSCIGKQISLHLDRSKPDMDDVQIALIGVLENRRDQVFYDDNFNLDRVRIALYSLFPGSWHTKIADLGDILPGETVEDTEFALRETLSFLLAKNIIPIILGGGQDLTYTQYRAYDFTEKMINLVNIDANFDIGRGEDELTGSSYIGKMIVSEPYNLFNYVNLGYQTYLNPVEEIDLIENLFFEAYRIGELTEDLSLAEPILRDADIVSVDLNVVNSQVSGSFKLQPNGFDGREICTLTRYAGISENVSSFGLYNLQHLDSTKGGNLLAAQMLWYFIEGINFRKHEYNISDSDKFIKYSVPLEEEVLTFYQSLQSERWWVEIPLPDNNNFLKQTFLPCSHRDYLQACNQEIPDRWYRATRRYQL